MDDFIGVSQINKNAECFFCDKAQLKESWEVNCEEVGLFFTKAPLSRFSSAETHFLIYVHLHTNLFEHIKEKQSYRVCETPGGGGWGWKVIPAQPRLLKCIFHEKFCFCQERCRKWNKCGQTHHADQRKKTIFCFKCCWSTDTSSFLCEEVWWTLTIIQTDGTTGVTKNLICLGFNLISQSSCLAAFCEWQLNKTQHLSWFKLCISRHFRL